MTPKDTSHSFKCSHNTWAPHRRVNACWWQYLQTAAFYFLCDIIIFKGLELLRNSRCAESRTGMKARKGHIRKEELTEE